LVGVVVVVVIVVVVVVVADVVMVVAMRIAEVEDVVDTAKDVCSRPAWPEFPPLSSSSPESSRVPENTGSVTVVRVARVGVENLIVVEEILDDSATVTAAAARVVATADSTVLYKEQSSFVPLVYDACTRNGVCPDGIFTSTTECPPGAMG